MAKKLAWIVITYGAEKSGDRVRNVARHPRPDEEEDCVESTSYGQSLLSTHGVGQPSRGIAGEHDPEHVDAAM